MAEKEYIEREALLAEYDRVHVGAPGGARRLMVDAPAADVVEVKHAKWEWTHGCVGYGIYCTNCKAGWRDSENVESIAYSHDYCPKCGAKMDGKRKEETPC
jgi:hypothetical protein